MSKYLFFAALIVICLSVFVFADGGGSNASNINPVGPGPTSCNEPGEVWDSVQMECVDSEDRESNTSQQEREMEREEIENRSHENTTTRSGIKEGNEREDNFNKSEKEDDLNESNDSNGRNGEVKIMPETASERAIERLGELNFTVVLKEVGNNESNKSQVRHFYQLNATKEARILGIFKAKAEVQAEVDAESGEVVRVHRPWWAFLASGI